MSLPKQQTSCSPPRMIMKKGSKSFDFATLFFSRKTRESVYSLYSWCRICDDITDGSHLGFNQNPHGLSKDRVNLLLEKTRLGVEMENAPLEAPFRDFGAVVRAYQIPLLYAEDLLLGMDQDARFEKPRTLDDLLLYCYRVAGTVGLMMCHIMGIKDERALKSAVDLGIALQLTNIVRDVQDDFRVGKTYIPLNWIQAEGLSLEELMAPEHDTTLKQIAIKLLAEADLRYHSGSQGLIDLPWRAALAVSIAASVYRSIGVQVIQRGDSAWKTRVTLGRWNQFKSALKGLLFLIKTLPHRLIDSRPIHPIQKPWRYS